MGLVAYRNTKHHCVHVGGRMVPPGETVHIDEKQMPGFSHTKVPAPAPDESAGGFDPAEILAGTVASVLESLPGVSDIELTEIEAAEAAAEKPRRGVMEGIAAEHLRRAAGGDEQAELIARLGEASDDDLDELEAAEYDAEEPNEDVLEAIAGERAARAEGKGDSNDDDDTPDTGEAGDD